VLADNLVCTSAYGRRVMELFGIRLLGLNAVTRNKVLFSAAFLLITLLVGVAAGAHSDTACQARKDPAIGAWPAIRRALVSAATV
jgi:hypothetical protein